GLEPSVVAQEVKRRPVHAGPWGERPPGVDVSMGGRAASVKRALNKYRQSSPRTSQRRPPCPILRLWTRQSGLEARLVSFSCRALQYLRHIRGDPVFKFSCFVVQEFQFFIQFFQFLRKLEVVGSPLSHADVATRVQAPSLGFDLIQRGNLAESK